MLLALLLTGNKQAVLIGAGPSSAGGIKIFYPEQPRNAPLTVCR
jgi:hypothetical protein